MKIITLVISYLVLSSCTTVQDESFKRVNVDQYYRQSGMVRYFHSDLPKWSNLSYEANCQRTADKKYLKINHVMESFSLDYERAVHLQALFNFEIEVATAKKLIEPTLKEEEGLFFKSLDKINAGIRGFKKPTFRRLNLVWLDSFRGNYKALRSLMGSETMNLGRPVLISMCMSKKQVGDLLRREKIITGGSRIISFEYFSYYSDNGKFGARESLNLEKLLNNKSKKYFYYQDEVPRNIQGKFILRKIK